MEETLGKRIVANRKRLGMTQDQLAEQLGVTAQAVSKWENDQSCPDITMLPKLAEIFGITADELLGMESGQKVHEAEVIAEEEPEGIHFQKGNWEFNWDSGRRGALSMAMLVLLVGGLLLASNLMNWDASFWGIFWPSAVLVYGLFGLFPKFSFFKLGCCLFGGYYLLSNLNCLQFELGKELIFPILLLLFGFSLLADALRKPKKPRFRMRRNGENVYDSNYGKKTKTHFTSGEEFFDISLSFGEVERMIVMPKLSEGIVNVSFGQLTVDLRGCEAIAENCRIDANCSFGELTLVVPSKFWVKEEQHTVFGDIKIKGEPDQNPAGVISLNGNTKFGEIQVKYI